MGISRKNNTGYFTAISIAVAIFMLSDVLLGSTSISLTDLFAAVFGKKGPGPINDIVWLFRIPKMLTALLSGIALSICGLQMQTLFKNPLADPYILGISSGAGLGVAFFVMGSSALGITIGSSLGMNIGMAASAWIGALVVTFIIISLSHKLKDNLSLLIFGVMLGFIGSALIGLLQYFSSASSLKNYVLWSMGSFAGMTTVQLIILAALVLIGLIISIYNIKDLNILLLGEQYAKSIGVNVQRTRNRILIVVALLAGGVTAFCGPIGFIGIAVPHIARMLFKNADHKVLIPASALIGAAIMLLADIIAGLPGTSSVIPINTVSALLGIPIILFIILKKK